MFSNIIFVLMCHRHKFLEIIQVDNLNSTVYVFEGRRYHEAFFIRNDSITCPSPSEAVGSRA
jgi:hypothetical protein